MTDQCTIDIWTISLKGSTEELQVAQHLLSAEEQTRVKRLRFQAHQERTILALAQRRRILARYLNQPPKSIVFSVGPYGKPYILDHPIHFNLTHSHELALLAVSKETEVGIDIEYWRPRINIDGLVKKVFTRNEQETFLALAESQQTASFYQVWTSKEAFVKALGKGLYHPLAAIEVVVTPTLPPEILHTSGETMELKNYALRAVSVPPHYTAHLVVKNLMKPINVIYHRAGSHFPEDSKYC